MSDGRILTLLKRELDGTLTDLERRELDRRVLTDPEARRERADWARVLSAMTLPEPSLLKLDSMASAVIREVERRRAESRGPRMLMAASLIAAGFALFVLNGPTPDAMRITTPQVAHLGPAESAPVELRLGFDDPDDEDVGLVTIHF